MSYLYVTEDGASMGIDGGYYVVNCKDGVTKKVPKETLESVALFGNIGITTQCVRELLKMGIPVSYFSKNGAYYGRLESTGHKNIVRLKKQIFRSEDSTYSLELAKRIIKAKIYNQYIVLKRYCKNNDNQINNLLNDLKIYREKINMVKSDNELIGYEGAVAKSYFAVLSKIINPEFSFNGRNRMPPRDPFNSMISLGYTLLMYEIYGEIENKALTPYCGFLHKDHERHPTLASDLMEEWRAVIVDSVVMSLVQGNEIKQEHFIKDEETGAVYLTTTGIRIFLKKYEAKLRSENKYLDGISMSYRRCLWYQVNKLVNAIEEDNVELYNPVTIR